jgi:putative chitinase
MSKVTKELLGKIFPNTPASKRDRFVSQFNNILPKYGVTTKLRFAAFIANVGIESDRLKTTKEYGAESYFFKYNGRKDLGNIREGDGPRYKGRSVLQTTGRYNYWRVVVAYLKVLTGKDWNSALANSNWDAYLKSKEYDALLKEADKYNVNFLAKPELLEQFPHAVEAAGVFIKDNNLNDYADKGQFYGYAGKLNRGSAKKKALHYNDRLAIYNLAMKVIPDDFDLTGEIKEEIKEELSGVGSKKVSGSVVASDHNAVEIGQTETISTETGTVSETVVQTNEQDVSIPAQVKSPELYQGVGFWKVIRRDLAAVTGGNFGLEGLTQLIQQASGWPEWVVGLVTKLTFYLALASIGYLIFRVIHYGIDTWKKNQKVKLEVNNATDVKRKDIEWV